MVIPNFLLIGAAKAGTTSVTNYLDQHPEIFVCAEKDTCFFIFEGARPNFKGPGDESLNRKAIIDYTTYVEKFEKVEKEKAIGESSVWYLNSEKAAYNIKKYLKTVKIIVILRNPIERAYSSYLMTIGENREYYTFEEALKEEKNRIANDWEFIWHHVNSGLYYKMIKRYYELFDKYKISVFLYDDLKKDAVGFMRNVFKFLEVDESYRPDTSLRYNTEGGFPKNRFIYDLVNKRNPIIQNMKMLVPKKIRRKIRNKVNEVNNDKPEIKKETRKYLKETFKEDILKVQELIGRDLSMWLKE